MFGSTSSAQWWDASLISGEPFQYDDASALPSDFYSNAMDYSATASPDDLVQFPEDFFSLQTYASPTAFSPDASPSSPTGLFLDNSPPASDDADADAAPQRSSAHKSGGSSSSKRAAAGNPASSASVSGSKQQRRRSSHSSSSSSACSSAGGPKLRSSKRAPARKPPPPAPAAAEDVPDERRKARHNHNLVEKKYREHLNQQFEQLLSTLLETAAATASDGEDGTGGAVDQPGNLSKAAVLELARRTIQGLVEERGRLEQQVEWLRRERGGLSGLGVVPLPEVVTW